MSSGWVLLAITGLSADPAAACRPPAANCQGSAFPPRPANGRALISPVAACLSTAATNVGTCEVHVLAGVCSLHAGVHVLSDGDVLIPTY